MLKYPTTYEQKGIAGNPGPIYQLNSYPQAILKLYLPLAWIKEPSTYCNLYHYIFKLR